MIKLLFGIFKKDQQSIKMIKLSPTKKILVRLAQVIGVIIFFVAVMLPPLMSIKDLTDLVPFNIGILFMMIGFYLTMLIAFISSVGFVYASCYLDKNLENYLVLPIKKRDFVLSKLRLVYNNVLSITLLLALPFTILYLMYTNVTLHGVIAIIVYFMCMPILMIALACLIIGTVLYFVNKVKNKAMARVLIYVILFAFSFGTYMVFVFFMTGFGASEDISLLFNQVSAIFSKIGFLFFYPSWATNLLIYPDYLNLVYLLLGLVVSGIIFFYFEKVYFKGSIGFNEAGVLKSRKNKKLNFINASVTKWFFIKEAKDIFKTSAYFFNTVFGNILVVVIYLAMMAFAYFGSDLKGSLDNLPPELITMIEPYLNIHSFILITLVIGTFFATFNQGAATIFSRDAKILPYIKSLPINVQQAFFGKILFHALVEFLSLFIFMLLPMLVLKVSFVFILVSVLTMALIVLSTILIPVCIDLAFPTLDWESQTTVVKKSKSVWLFLLSSFLLNILFFALVYLVLGVFKFDYTILAYFGLGFYLVLFIVMFKVYGTLVKKAFGKVS